MCLLPFVTLRLRSHARSRGSQKTKVVSKGGKRLLPAVPILSVTVPSSWHFPCSCPCLLERNRTRPKRKGTLEAPDFPRLHFFNDSA
ncbi:unnamed protein product [Ixodes persulcatus]